MVYEDIHDRRIVPPKFDGTDDQSCSTKRLQWQLNGVPEGTALHLPEYLTRGLPSARRSSASVVRPVRVALLTVSGRNRGVLEVRRGVLSQRPLYRDHFHCFPGRVLQPPGTSQCAL
jgi:hypothetical protein